VLEKNFETIVLARPTALVPTQRYFEWPNWWWPSHSDHTRGSVPVTGPPGQFRSRAPRPQRCCAASVRRLPRCPYFRYPQFALPPHAPRRQSTLSPPTVVSLRRKNFFAIALLQCLALSICAGLSPSHRVVPLCHATAIAAATCPNITAEDGASSE
jgi:hypothetical protein